MVRPALQLQPTVRVLFPGGGLENIVQVHLNVDKDIPTSHRRSLCKG